MKVSTAMSATIPTIAARPLSCSTCGEKIFLASSVHGDPLNTSRHVLLPSIVNGSAVYPSFDENDGTSDANAHSWTCAAKTPKFSPSCGPFHRSKRRRGGVERRQTEVLKGVAACWD